MAVILNLFPGWIREVEVVVNDTGIHRQYHIISTPEPEGVVVTHIDENNQRRRIPFPMDETTDLAGAYQKAIEYSFLELRTSIYIVDWDVDRYISDHPEKFRWVHREYPNPNPDADVCWKFPLMEIL